MKVSRTIGRIASYVAYTLIGLAVIFTALSVYSLFASETIKAASEIDIIKYLFVDGGYRSSVHVALSFYFVVFTVIFALMLLFIMILHVDAKKYVNQFIAITLGGLIAANSIIFYEWGIARNLAKGIGDFAICIRWFGYAIILVNTIILVSTIIGLATSKNGLRMYTPEYIERKRVNKLVKAARKKKLTEIRAAFLRARAIQMLKQKEAYEKARELAIKKRAEELVLRDKKRAEELAQREKQRQLYLKKKEEERILALKKKEIEKKKLAEAKALLIKQAAIEAKKKAEAKAAAKAKAEIEAKKLAKERELARIKAAKEHEKMLAAKEAMVKEKYLAKKEKEAKIIEYKKLNRLAKLKAIELEANRRQDILDQKVDAKKKARLENEKARQARLKEIQERLAREKELENARRAAKLAKQREIEKAKQQAKKLALEDKLKRKAQKVEANKNKEVLKANKIKAKKARQEADKKARQERAKKQAQLKVEQKKAKAEIKKVKAQKKQQALAKEKAEKQARLNAARDRKKLLAQKRNAQIEAAKKAKGNKAQNRAAKKQQRLAKRAARQKARAEKRSNKKVAPKKKDDEKHPVIQTKKPEVYKVYHILPYQNGKQWHLKKMGDDKIIKATKTQAELVAYVHKNFDNKNDVRVFIHDNEGKFYRYI